MSEAKLSRKETGHGVDPVAVIGIGCRFPGGVFDAESFWKLMAAGTDAISEVPEGRWNINRFYDPEPGPGKTYSRWGGFLGDVKGFDAAFFGISPREAIAMDPQQRLLLEVAWEAFEDAGQFPGRLSGSKTGVYVGLWSGDYEDLVFSDPDQINFYHTQGTGRYTAAGRISYMLGLQGPALALDTACSSSLVTVHLACQALRNEECGLAIAGGVNLLLQPQVTIAYSQSKMMSPEGRCKFGDATGAGYVRSEGVGLVVLKPLEKALADGDRIRAIIRGSAINNDGRSSGSFGTPGLEGQEAMLRDAYDRAGVQGRDVVYVEAHGTGTKKGDPVEIQAIGRILGAGHNSENPLYIGSVKTNIGHMEAAAGIGGLIKTVLCLEHSAIPASLHFKEPNPLIPWNSLPVRIPTSIIPIDRREDEPVIAGVNSFGISGTNAHIVLEAPPHPQETPASSDRSKDQEILTLSARSEMALKAMAKQYITLFRSENLPFIRDVCFSANTRRSRLDYRLAVWGESPASLASSLEKFLQEENIPELSAGKIEKTNSSLSQKPVFVFSGQGSQWSGMARSLLETQPVFRNSILEIENLVSEYAGWNLREELSRDAEKSQLDRIGIMWPCIFAVQVSLARLLIACEIQPSAVIGHSIGEAAAAFVSGALSLKDAVRVIVHQGRLVERASGTGAMALVGLSFDETERRLGGTEGVTVAIASSPLACVISGEQEVIRKLQTKFEMEGVFARLINTNAAVHSPAMEPIRAELIDTLTGIIPQNNSIPYYSSVAGSMIPGDILETEYWWRNIRLPVFFSDACGSLLKEHDIFLEISPHPIVSVSVSECARELGREVAVISTLRRNEMNQGLSDILHSFEKDGGLFSSEPSENAAPVPVYQKHPDRPNLAFVFSGQGQQWWAMGRELLKNDPVFREKILEIDRLLSEYAKWSLIEELQREETSTRLHETEIAQPAIFGLQVALAAVWETWGVTPSAVIGHSVGEVAAAHIAGVLDLKTAVRVIFHRGRLMQEATGLGKMAALEMSYHEALLAIQGFEDRVAVGASNSSTSAVLSGQTEALEEILTLLAEKGISHKMLPVNYAFHSPQMEPFKRELVETLSGLRVQSAKIPIVSTVSGRFAYGEDFSSSYWGDNVRQGVLFAEGINSLILSGISQFVEISAHPVLSAYINQSLEMHSCTGFSLPSLRRNFPADTSMRVAFAQLFLNGYSPDWKKYYGPGVRVVPIPGYPWQHEQYWLEPVTRRKTAGLDGDLRKTFPLLRTRLDAAFPIFEAEIDARDFSDLFENSIFDMEYCPPAILIEIALEAVNSQLNVRSLRLSGIEFLAPCLLEGDRKTFQAVLSPGGENQFQFRIFSKQEIEENTEWREHVRGHMTPIVSTESSGLESFDISTLASRMPRLLSPGEHFSNLAGAGLELGEAWRLLESFQNGDDELLASLKSHESARSYFHSPFAFESGFEMISALDGTDEKVPLVPWSIDSIEFFESRAPQYIWIKKRTESFDIHYLDASGTVTSRVEGLRMRRMRRTDLLRLSKNSLSDWIYGLDWRSESRKKVSAKPGESWLIFADQSGSGDALAKRLVASGGIPNLVAVGDQFSVVSAGHWTITPEDELGFTRIFNEIGAVDRVIYLWGLDLTMDPTDRKSLDMMKGQSVACVGLLNAAISRVKLNKPTPFTIVTRGARFLPGDTGGNPIQATALGLATVIELEHPEFNPLSIDLDPARQADENEILFEEIIAQKMEAHVAIRGGKLFSEKLTPFSTRTLNPAIGSDAGTTVEPRCLEISERGFLDNLRVVSSRRRAPGPDEVEIQIKAAGLNFKDVLWALDMLPGQPGKFGLECSGIIVTVGENVRTLRVGDEVMAMCTGGSHGNFTTVHADLVIAKPVSLSFEEAAGVPVTLLTTFYGLYHQARITAGDRILIHSAAGGVGLTAVRMAQLKGAEIFATCSTPEKRALLERLGVRHIFDSRNLDFVNEIMKITGDGVDIVLNSLAREFIPASIKLLRPGGRYIEIGKKDILNAKEVASLKKGISYFVFDLMDVARERPDLIQSMLMEIAGEFANGSLSALPLNLFPLSRASDAFRYMAAGKHIGKIVLNEMESGNSPAMAPVQIRGDATYLITGGLGALGLLFARRLAEKGARTIALTGRSGASAEVLSALSRMEEETGTRFVVLKGDISLAPDVERMFAEISKLPALRGVIHAAGVLDDGVMLSQTRERFLSVMGPKVAGSWNLHQRTIGSHLDFFVLFSSIVSLLGSPGQSNYAAANAFMDSLASYRRARGLPGLSINWGPWADAGMAQDSRVEANFLDRGIYFLPPETGLEAFEKLISLQTPRAGVFYIQWNKYLAKFPGERRGFYSELAARFVSPESTVLDTGKVAASFVDSLRATPVSERRRVLLEHVAAQLAHILGASPDSIDEAKGFKDMGLDSLMTVELRNRLQANLKCPLPPTLAFDYPNVNSLVNFLYNDALAISEETATGDPPVSNAPGESAGTGQFAASSVTEAADVAGIVKEMATLSDEDALAALLAQ